VSAVPALPFFGGIHKFNFDLASFDLIELLSMKKTTKFFTILVTTTTLKGSKANKS